MPIECDLLLSAEYIITQNSQREIIHHGFIAISNGKIVGLGSKEDAHVWQATKKIDLGQALIMPGLCNAHTHVAMTFLRGLADDMPLMDWLQNFIFPVEAKLSAEIVELASLLGCAEMISTGTTAFVDMYLFSNAVAQAVDKIGMKALLGEVLFEFPSASYGQIDEGFEEVLKMKEKWHNKAEGRVKVGIMPHTVYTTNFDILTKSVQLAHEHNLVLHIHVAETPVETKTCLDRYGLRPLEVCRQTGILGPTTNIAHAVDLTDEELNLIKTTETKISHNPKSNFKLASGVAPIHKMLNRGICVALGTDGAASNNSLNMFSEMKFCALAHKGVNLDPAMVSAQDTLDMATRSAAKAMNSSHFGHLSPGMDADLTALSLTSPNMQPLYNPISHLVYAATGHEVCLTMVNGEILYQDGKFLSMDYPLLLDEIKKISHWVQKKIT